MTPHDSREARASSLSGLSVLAPDRDRAERVRTTIHAELGRRERRAARTAAMAGFAWRVLAPAVVGAFCAFYAAMLMAVTLRFEGFLD
jgi:hypothetical protein